MEALMAEPTLPFWFRQRQGNLEPAGPELYRVTAPNLGESYLGIRAAADGRWQAVVKAAADGPDTVVSEQTFATPHEAWEAAFELFRLAVIV
jgi:hypothetical protein